MPVQRQVHIGSDAAADLLGHAHFACLWLNSQEKRVEERVQIAT